MRFGYLLFLSGLFAAVFLLLGCWENKSTRKNAQIWLDQNFPGKFEVLDTESAATWAKPDFDVSILYIGLKADPDVQFTLRWNKTRPDGKLQAAEVEEALQDAQRDAERARALLSCLKNKGLDKVQVGVSAGSVAVLLYAECTLPYRERVLGDLHAALQQWPEISAQSVRIFFMEENAFDPQAKAVVPKPLAFKQTTLQQANTVYYLDYEWTDKLTLSDLAEHLAVNAASARDSIYRMNAFEKVQAWALKNAPPGIQIESAQMVMTTVDEHKLRCIYYDFPFVLEAKPAAPNTPGGSQNDGYINCIYDTDSGKTTDIRLIYLENEGE